jgi:hypothetical protein
LRGSKPKSTSGFTLAPRRARPGRRGLHEMSETDNPERLKAPEPTMENTKNDKRK